MIDLDVYHYQKHSQKKAYKYNGNINTRANTKLYHYKVNSQKEAYKYNGKESITNSTRIKKRSNRKLFRYIKVGKKMRYSRQESKIWN